MTRTPTGSTCEEHRNDCCSINDSGCEKALELFALAWSAEATDEQWEWLEGHLATCSACAWLFQALQDIENEMPSDWADWRQGALSD